MGMFCYQCQETAKNSGCTIQGVCGKKADTANLQDKLIQQLKIIACTLKPSLELGRFICNSLFMTITNANFDDARINKQIAETQKLLGGKTCDAPLGVLSAENEDVRSLRELLTYGLKGSALMPNTHVFWAKKT